MNGKTVQIRRVFEVLAFTAFDDLGNQVILSRIGRDIQHFAAAGAVIGNFDQPSRVFKRNTQTNVFPVGLTELVMQLTQRSALGKGLDRGTLLQQSDFFLPACQRFTQVDFAQ